MISLSNFRCSVSHKEGRFAIVTDVECGMRWTLRRRARECSQGDSFRERNTARRTSDIEAYGKTVWSWHPLLVLSSRRLVQPNRVGSSREFVSDGDKQEFVTGESPA